VAVAIQTLRAGDGGFRLADSFVSIALQNAAAYAIVLGELEAAHAAADEALVEARRAGLPNWITVSIQHLATVAALRGETRAAARLCGYCDMMFEREGMARGYTEARTYAILRAALLAGASVEEVAHGTAEGAALTADQAIEIAFALS
jgi:hypothetical protein